MLKFLVPIGLSLSVIVGGCQVSPLEAQWPEPRPLASEYATYRPSNGAAWDQVDASRAIQPDGVLTLNDALRLSMEHHPALASFAWERRVREAQAEQAGRFPNPELGLEVENFAGTDETSGFDSAETTISIAQVIPGGDRIEKAVREAELNRDLAGWDFEAARIQVASTTARRFLEVLVAQRRIGIAQRNLELSERIARIANRRVEAGDVPPSERARAKVASGLALIELKRAQAHLDATRRSLSGQWAGIEPGFDEAQGELEVLAEVPPLARLIDRLDENPDLARWAAETSWRRSQLRLAQALAEPDVTLAGGVRYLGEVNDTALVASLSLPLTINDRNQGGIRAAQAELMKAGHDRRQAEIGLRLALVQAHQTLSSAFDEAIALRDDVLPAAQSVFDAANRAYEQGQIGWLDEIDARRTLMDVQTRYLDVLAIYHRVAVQIEGLIGHSLQAPFVDEARTTIPSEMDTK